MRQGTRQAPPKCGESRLGPSTSLDVAPGHSQPGITDPASIAYSNEPEILKTVQNPENYYIENILPNKLSLNKSYLCKMNFFEDLRLIFKTLYVLIRKNLVARKITDK